MALEDAACLGILLACIKTVDEIEHALQLYLEIRKARADEIVLAASQLKAVLHVDKSEAEVARDKAFREAASTGKNPDTLVNAGFQDRVYGCECFMRSEVWVLRKT